MILFCSTTFVTTSNVFLTKFANENILELKVLIVILR